MTNLIEGIQEKCNYIREHIIPEYEAIGPAGAIGKSLLLQQIKSAEAYIANGDIIDMLLIYKSLEETCRSAL